MILFSLPVIIVCILMIIMHLITERMQISQNLIAQRMKLREQISRDLHDDLASTLGSISIYSDTLKRIENPSHSEFRKLAKKIAELTQSALQAITDIIWMTSPKNDSVQGLLTKANNLLYEIFIDNGIEYHSEINAPNIPIVLPDELKNDTFLILKEATHNIIRHSKAKSVTLNADINDHTCIISLMDDGIGFDENNLCQHVSHGNGLINMKKRALDSKIDLSINSQAGKGTVITLVFKI
jgi:signal transduction histidine kinase